jgi:hypothetical protein
MENATIFHDTWRNKPEPAPRIEFKVSEVAFHVSHYKTLYLMFLIFSLASKSILIHPKPCQLIADGLRNPFPIQLITKHATHKFFRRKSKIFA